MSKYYMFTWNNPTESGEAFATYLDLIDEVTYYTFQLEQGENGTPHFQGYIELGSRKRITWMTGNVKQMHYERRMGNQSQAVNYCNKEESRVEGPWTNGELAETNQGKRNDLVEFKDQVILGKRKRELIDDFPLHMARYPKFYDTIKSCIRPTREEELEVRLNFGDTGTGKTRYAYDNFGDSDDFYVIPISNGTVWFDGFDSHTTVLIDDFAGAASKMSLCNTLRILDRYPIRVPVKGGHQWFMPKMIIVTSNMHPRHWYKWDNREEQYRALCRRFTQVYRYTQGNDEPEQIEMNRFTDDYYLFM